MTDSTGLQLSTLAFFFLDFCGAQRLEALEGIERERQRLGDLLKNEGAIQTTLRGDVAAAREVPYVESRNLASTKSRSDHIRRVFLGAPDVHVLVVSTTVSACIFELVIGQ